MNNDIDKVLWGMINDYLMEKGLRHRAASMILYAMAVEALTYEEARDIYAEWVGVAPERVQSSLCYDVLSAGMEIPPAKLLGDFLEELKNNEN